MIFTETSIKIRGHETFGYRATKTYIKSDLFCSHISLV